MKLGEVAESPTVVVMVVVVVDVTGSFRRRKVPKKDLLSQRMSNDTSESHIERDDFKRLIVFCS